MIKTEDNMKEFEKLLAAPPKMLLEYQKEAKYSPQKIKES